MEVERFQETMVLNVHFITSLSLSLTSFSVTSFGVTCLRVTCWTAAPQTMHSSALECMVLTFSKYQSIECIQDCNSILRPERTFHRGVQRFWWFECEFKIKKSTDKENSSHISKYCPILSISLYWLYQL